MIIQIIIQVIVVLEIGVHLLHLAGHRVDLVFVLHAVQYKLHLILAVIQVVFLFHKLDVIPSQLGRKDLLGCAGVDVPLVTVGIVVVVLVQSHRPGADLIGLHLGAHRGSQLLQKGLAGILRTPLHFQHDVFGLALDGGVEIAVVINLGYQLGNHRLAGLTLVVGAAGQYRLAVLVETGQADHIAAGVVGDLDFRIDAEQQGAHAAVAFGSNGLRGGAVGQRTLAGTAGKDTRGQGSGEGAGKQGSSQILFHFRHLL